MLAALWNCYPSKSMRAQAIVAGTISFPRTCDDLFGGVIVTIYRMRNMLLHGELKPDPAALACYEPAYRLLRRMLQECR